MSRPFKNSLSASDLSKPSELVNRRTESSLKIVLSVNLNAGSVFFEDLHEKNRNEIIINNDICRIAINVCPNLVIFHNHTNEALLNT
ncbi:hypothetical protein D3C78_1095920 [compost metagenome]